MINRLLQSALLLVWLLATAASAQERLPDNLSEFYSYGDNYYLEVATLPGGGAPGAALGKGRAVVSFRLSYDLLTFRKTPQAYQKGSVYMATPTIYMEAVGSDGVIVARGSWSDTARVQDYAATNSKTDFICGSVELPLRSGMYVVKYSFDDGTPGNGFTQSTQPFKMDDFNSPSPAIGIPIFLKGIAGDTLIPAAVDGSAMFGRRFRAFIPLASNAPPKELRYELATPARKDGEPAKVLRTGRGTLLGSMWVGKPIPAGKDLLFPISHDVADSSHAYGGLVDFASDDLGVGEYILVLTYDAGFNSVTDSVRLRLRWVDMPFSLARAEYAIKVLYPIASDDAIDDMLSGDKQAQRAAVDKFWEGRDPTPGSKFNEAMNEYYKRADYAFFNFKSIGQNDGAFTDRGKIYLLNGPPSEVTREMQPNASPREIWIYRNAVKQRFTFVDKSGGGEYRLVEYNDL
jgi:GWxTD domain-containing protein